MVEAMTRAGGRGAGLHSEPTVGLSVGWTARGSCTVDLRPTWNATRDTCLLLHGEEFTSPEDRQAATPGAVGDSDTDAAYALRLYALHGERFVEHLNGCFVGLLVDRIAHRVIVFNDRYGLRRLYLHEEGGVVHFASQAKALLRAKPELRRFEASGLGEMFSHGCVMQNRTLFSGIAILPPGSRWTLQRDGGLRKESYAVPAQWESQPRLSEPDYVEALDATFRRILPAYFRGAGGVGMSLTGGLDGRMIMARAGADAGTLRCYTFGGPYRECADVRIARRVAAICGQPHEIIPVGDEFIDRFPALAEEAVVVSDGAMDITGAVELYVNRLAREIAPVRLTGNYGSEILRQNVAFRPGVFTRRLLDPEFARHVDAAAATYRHERAVHDLTFIAFKQVPWYHFARFSVEESQLTVRSPYLDNALVSLAYRIPPTLVGSPKPALHVVASGSPELARVPTDRGVEISPTPVLSALRATACQLSAKAEYAFDYGMPQWLARLDRWMAPPGLERAFLGRHKFYHFRVWYRDRLARYLKEILLDPRALSRPYLDGREVRRMVEDHTRGVANHTSEIHRILSLELLQRRLMDGR
jgi:asparagine synthase (glutamine-hydrolysing)